MRRHHDYSTPVVTSKSRGELEGEPVEHQLLRPSVVSQASVFCGLQWEARRLSGSGGRRLYVLRSHAKHGRLDPQYFIKSDSRGSHWHLEPQHGETPPTTTPEPARLPVRPQHIEMPPSTTPESASLPVRPQHIETPPSTKPESASLPATPQHTELPPTTTPEPARLPVKTVQLVVWVTAVQPVLVTSDMGDSGATMWGRWKLPCGSSDSRGSHVGHRK